MTKEPIMMDGVDVAECEKLYTSNLPIGNDKIKCGLHQGKTCDNYPNCYYKQLKRKEQECEEWKSKYYNSTTEVKADLIKQLDQLETECEKWKSKYYNSTTEVKADLIKQLDQLETECEKWKNNYHKSTAK